MTTLTMMWKWYTFTFIQKLLYIAGCPFKVKSDMEKKKKKKLF